MKSQTLRVIAFIFVLIFSFTALIMPMSAATYKVGDMNSDGKVDSDDAIYLLRHTLKPNQYPLACEHELTDYPAKDATCTDSGYKAYSACSKCSYTTYESIPALGHSKVSHSAKAASCTEVGWNAYYTCSRCTYTTYEEIPSLGHSFSNGFCTRCGNEQGNPWNGTADTSWYNTSATTFTITTPEQLAGFAKLVNDGNNFSGKTVKLGTYVNLAGKEWTPIGTSTGRLFKGVFDGQNNTITNFKCTVANTGCDFLGLFGYSEGEIKNVTVKNFVIDATVDRAEYAFAAGIVAQTKGKVTNCHAEGSVTIQSPKNLRAGGIAGSNSSGTVEACTAKVTINASTSGSQFVVLAGGLVGNNLNGTIKSSSASGNVTATATADSNIYAGGLIGENQKGSAVNCYSSGSVSAYSNDSFAFSGGFAGENAGTIINCYSTGNASAESPTSAPYAGGFAGYNEGAILDCYSKGNVTVKAVNSPRGACAFVGGFVAENDYTITNCYSTGNITADINDKCGYIGGFVGRNSDIYGGTTDYYAAISNSYTTGNITIVSANASYNGIGGFVGEQRGVINNCYRSSTQTITTAQAPNTALTPSNTIGTAKTLSVIKTAAFHKNTLKWTECCWTMTDNSFPVNGKSEHSLVSHEGKEASCTTAGWIPYLTCQSCTLTTYSAIPAGQHDVVSYSAKPATCTESGYAAYEACTKCNYTTYKAIAALGHSTISQAGKAATCVSDGFNSYVICSRCSYTTYSATKKTGHNLSGGSCRYCGLSSTIDITKFASKTNYNYLGTLSNGAKLQTYYNVLDSQLTAFHKDTSKNASVLVDSGYSYNVVAETNYNQYGLTKNQAVQVWQAFRDDHPLYYWLTDYIYSSTTIYSLTYNAYDQGSERASYNNDIYNALLEYIYPNTGSSKYEIALRYFDDIIQNCNTINVSAGTYYTNIYKECSIAAPLISGNGLNSGYAKLYQALLNYSGIENWYTWGENPWFIAWNIAKLDDGKWYWFDLAIADNSSYDALDIHSYFCQPQSTLPSTHTAFTVSYSPTAPTLSTTAFDSSNIVEVNSNFTVNNVKYKRINSDNQVVVLSYAENSKRNIYPTVTYQGIIYSVIDVYVENNKSMNTVLFESNTGYNYLGTLSNASARQKMYEELDAKMTLFHSCEPGGYMQFDTDLYQIGMIDYGKYGLSYNDAVGVLAFYRQDHPLYYWLSTSWVYNTSTNKIFPCTNGDYLFINDRLQLNDIVNNGINNYIEVAKDETDPYYIALAYYNELIMSNDYSYDSSGNPTGALWAHSILGAFIKNEFVCEGYAKLYQLLLNYSGVENRYIVGDAGGGHAWNLVKFSDGKWYWCDATWGDVNVDTYITYFAGTDETFKTHIPYPSSDSQHPGDILPPVPTSSKTEYSNPNGIELSETFTVDGIEYTCVLYNVAWCLTDFADGETPPETVTYMGREFDVYYE